MLYESVFKKINEIYKMVSGCLVNLTYGTAHSVKSDIAQRTDKYVETW